MNQNLNKIKNQLSDLLKSDENFNKAELQAYKDMKFEKIYDFERLEKPYDSFQNFKAL